MSKRAGDFISVQDLLDQVDKDLNKVYDAE